MPHSGLAWHLQWIQRILAVSLNINFPPIIIWKCSQRSDVEKKPKYSHTIQNSRALKQHTCLLFYFIHLFLVSSLHLGLSHHHGMVCEGQQEKMQFKVILYSLPLDCSHHKLSFFCIAFCLL